MTAAKPGPRRRLPARRPSFTERFSHGLQGTFHLTAGIDEAGRVREVFIAGPHTESEQQLLIDDACIACSVALQHGASIADMADRLEREHPDPMPGTGMAASVLGAACRLAARLEAEGLEARS